MHPEQRRDGRPARKAMARLEEAVGLALAIDLEVVHNAVVRLTQARPATLIGKGAIEALGQLITEQEVGLCVIDGALTPIQQRNLERAWSCKVIDRTGLILEIFGERARTKEGQLQVELAALTYQRSRLVRSWTHLERQRGGFGFLGGPGERQLEIDRRLTSERIARIERELEKVKRTRALHRKARQRVPFPVVALVGYTNAGKSTLFNRLTRAGVVARDMLFATLDPTMRKLVLPGGREVILSDTVGFISELPTGLVAAFRATLEEVFEAGLILHVRDVAHPDSEAQRHDVQRVLEEMGLEERLETDVIEVLNKVDLLDAESRGLVAAQAARRADSVAVSAVTGEGLDDLLTLIERRLARDQEVHEISVLHSDGAALAWLYEHGSVVSRDDETDCARLRVALNAEDWRRFQRQHGSRLRIHA
ncbi:MAG: GTPase HflX [Rhodospirillales bacterium]|nr:GTPase HflX [Rhodospirillales bacterium]